MACDPSGAWHRLKGTGSARGDDTGMGSRLVRADGIQALRQSVGAAGPFRGAAPSCTRPQTLPSRGGCAAAAAAGEGAVDGGGACETGIPLVTCRSSDEEGLVASGAACPLGRFAQ